MWGKWKMENGKWKILKFHILCSLLFTLYSFPAFVHAAALDTSVDEEIRRKYNPSKLEQDMALPALPKILQENGNINPDIKSVSNIAKPTVSTVTNVKQASNVKQKDYYKSEQSVIRLKKGTRIKLRLQNGVSDSTQKGAKLTFNSIYPVKTKYMTIPAGTMFQGYVVNSHKPQLSGNGGLIVIAINSMILNDEVQPISAKVVKANKKHIFRNNIKGKRTYIKSMLSAAKPGHRFYLKMLNIAAKNMNQTSGLIITPLTFASGVAVFGSNVLVSPVIAMFHKGGHISLREGSEVDVKLMQDVFVYN